MDVSKNQRVAELIAELKNSRKIRNQSHFAEIVGSDKATISEIVREQIDVPKKLFGKILEAFPEISPDWLESGEGPMFRRSEPSDPFPVHVEGDYANFGNQKVSIMSPEVMSYLREEQRQSAVHLSQIDRLIAIIEHITGTPFHGPDAQ